jgi:hypothetical protein
MELEVDSGIGDTAGKVWKVLSGKGESTISRLIELTREKEPLVHQALGWLAREGKIEMHAKGNRTVVSLKR